VEIEIAKTGYSPDGKKDHLLTVCGVVVRDSKYSLRIAMDINAAFADHPEIKRLREIEKAARRVMELLEKHGPGIVPHLMDCDENVGQELRDLFERGGWEAPQK
jgi:hypothetical protein